MRIDGTHIQIEWKREHTVCSHLAPTRRDLLYRIVRNALPLGYKRMSWGVEYKKTCPNCEEEEVETAKHLFWECGFARRIWQQLKQPWRGNHNQSATWRDVVVGTDMTLQHSKDNIHDMIWTIIRACIIRVIWLERNHRIFNPEVNQTQWKVRANQAALDIRAHLESMVRRSNDNTKAKVNTIISHLKYNNPRLHHLFEHNSLFNQMT